MNIGNKIAELRKQHNITQEILAAEMGVSIAAVSKWENSNSMPDIIMVCSLADYFNVSTDELLGRKDISLNFIIADDSEFICKSIETILVKNKHKCLAKLTNGIELLNELEKLNNTLPDCLFLDINMPKMGGLTALMKIHEKYPQLKVIVCTADTTAKTKDQAIDLGAVGYITKPFMPEHIELTIHSL